MLPYLLNFVKIQRCSDIFQCLKYFNGNKERSEKSLILEFFNRKQCNNYVMSLNPVFTGNGSYIFVNKIINTHKGQVYY